MLLKLEINNLPSITTELPGISSLVSHLRYQIPRFVSEPKYKFLSSKIRQR